MISMHPIKEQIVLDSLNAQKYGDNAMGYVVMNGENYLGHILFSVDKELTTVQECKLENTAVIDGAVRACVAYGESEGATHFTVNNSDEKLLKWVSVFFKNKKLPLNNNNLIGNCQK